MSVAARRRTLAALALVALAIVAVLLIGRGGDDSSPAKDRAVQLVPANALVYAHVSTSRDNEDARRLAARFPSFGRLRDGILRRLSVSGRGGNVDKWLGNDAALALLPAQGTTAGSLVVVGVRDEKAARDFVASGRGSGSTQGTYHGVKLNQYGQVLAAFVDGFLVLGQKASVQQAIDLAQGRGRGLADEANYRRAIKGLPEDRVIDAYATGDGVRRLLTPAGGLLGIAGVLLDRPGLRATALALEVKEPGAVLTSHTLGDPGDFGPFRPQLLAKVPSGSLVYLGLKGFDRVAARLLALTGQQQAGSFARLIARNRSKLRGEVAVVLSAQGDGTALTLLAPGNVVLSTGSPPRRGGGLAKEPAFRRVVPDAGSRVTAVGFLDFDQLLKLAERTGLNDSQAYRAVRADLAQVHAVGFSSSGSRGDTTAEIRFDIP